MKRGMKKWIFAIIAFVIALYLVEASPWSSRAVAGYNNGYGTFDMKQYDKENVAEVLADMEEGGVAAYDRYLLMDTIFILAFGWLQILMARDAGDKGKSVLIKRAGVGAALARGGFDLVENILLFLILHAYPNMNGVQIRIAGIATRLKLACIGVWGILFVAGMILARTKSRKEISSRVIFKR